LFHAFLLLIVVLRHGTLTLFTPIALVSRARTKSHVPIVEKGCMLRLRAANNMDAKEKAKKNKKKKAKKPSKPTVFKACAVEDENEASEEEEEDPEFPEEEQEEEEEAPPAAEEE